MSPPTRFLPLSALAAFGLAFIPSSRAAAAAPASPVDWSEEARILARIHPPEFPDRSFPITQFGAAAGADCTEAIAKAIAACHTAGGGHVIVPAGVFKTGAVHLLSGVDLHLEAGSTLSFSVDPASYLPVVHTRYEGTECMNYSPLIYAFEQENIAVTGTGTLDGNASDENWWKWVRRTQGSHSAPATADIKALNDLADQGVPVGQRVFGAGHKLRPNFFEPTRCRNVMIEGVKIVGSPMWEINPVLCANVTVRNVRISSLGPNNDGCDPESSKDVLVEGCSFNTGDDCMAIKSGRNDDGRRVHVPVENLVIRNCAMLDGHAGVAIGSEISGGCRNVFIENCTMDSPQLQRALRLKSNARRGGVIENIFMRDVKIGQVTEAILTVDFLYEEGPKGNFPPVVRNVWIDRIAASAAPRMFYIQGFKGATIDGIRLTNSSVGGVNQPEVIRHAGRIELENVDVVPAKVPRSQSSRE